MSPTASAIDAGFRGSSSGKEYSTLPTKSAATSAVFVYIPPPALANSAIEDAPNENPKIISGSPKKKYNAQTPPSAAPTTIKPITAPAKNETLNAGASPLVDACAVFALASTPTRIPNHPAQAEAIDPTR